MDLKVNPAPLDNKATLELRVFQVLREQLDLQERRAPMESRVYQECQEPTDLRVTPEKKGLLEKKETWVLLVLRGRLDIQGREV